MSVTVPSDNTSFSTTMETDVYISQVTTANPVTERTTDNLAPSSSDGSLIGDLLFIKSILFIFAMQFCLMWFV